jgi:hypothetical protein
MNIKFFHADGSSYFFLDRLLIVPFGYNYVDRKPSPVQFGECSLTGVFLKTNNNCAVIDLDNQSGLRRYTSFYVSTNDAFLGKRRYVVFI